MTAFPLFSQPPLRPACAARPTLAVAGDNALPKRWYNLDIVLTNDFPHA